MLFFFFNLTICDNQNIKLLLPGTLITSKLQVIFTENWCFLSVSQKQCLFLLFELSWQRIRLQCRRPGFYPWVGKIPRRRERLPTPVFWLGEFLACYSSRCHKELHITKWLSFSITRELVWPLLGWEWLTSRKCRLSLQTLWWASWLTPSN